MRLRLFLCGVLAASLSASAADGADFVLVKAQGIARTMEYTGTYPAAWDKDVQPGQQSVVLGGYFKGRFRIDEAFGGDLAHRTIRLKLSMISQLVRMPEMFLVLDMRRKDDVTAIWWNRTDSGFCLDTESLRKVDLQAAGRAASREYPCAPAVR